MPIAVIVLPVTTSVAAEQSAFAAVTSNYVFRGQTQTDDDPAIQGGYDIKQSKGDFGWYAGTKNDTEFFVTVAKTFDILNIRF